MIQINSLKIYHKDLGGNKKKVMVMSIDCLRQFIRLFLFQGSVPLEIQTEPYRIIRVSVRCLSIHLLQPIFSETSGRKMLKFGTEEKKIEIW